MDALSDPPWVVGTVEDKGSDLFLDDLDGADISLLVEGEGRPVGTFVQVHWFAVGDGVPPAPPFDTAWMAVTRPNATMRFTIPAFEVNVRGGHVLAGYSVVHPDGTLLTSPSRSLSVYAASTLLAPIVTDSMPFRLSTPRQPWMFAASTRVTFFWEPEDDSDDAIRGWQHALPGSSPPSCPLPSRWNALLQGQSMRFWYVASNASGTGPGTLCNKSGDTIVTLDASGRDDALLPAPWIPGADPTRILLDTFGLSIPIRIAPWPRIAQGQRISILAAGTTNQGEVNVEVCKDALVEDVTYGFEASVAKSALEELLDGTKLQIQCSIHSDEPGGTWPVNLSAASYTVVREPSFTGRLVEFEQMDDVEPTDAGESQRLRFLTLEVLAGSIEPSGSPDERYISDSCVALASDQTQIKIIFDRAFMSVRLGAFVSDPSYPGMLRTFTKDGRQLQVVHIEKSATLELRGDDDGDAISYVEISSSTAYGIYIDSVICGNNGSWAEKTGTITETFDDLSEGSYGPVFAFSRWTISSNSGEVAVVPDPASSNERCTSIRSTSLRPIHYLTPNFAYRPKKKISMRVRTSAQTSHTATVDAVYLNKFDLTTRTLTTYVEIEPRAQVITFGKDDMANDMEYLSHLRIVHDSDDRSSAILYDNISLS